MKKSSERLTNKKEILKWKNCFVVESQGKLDNIMEFLVVSFLKMF